MKIIIDTKEDSKEDIIKASEFLKSIANQNNKDTDFSVNESPMSSFGAMFSDTSTTEQNEDRDYIKEKKETKENLRIEPY